MNAGNKKTKKLIIWDLCGGSQNSVYKGLIPVKGVEIYTFDIIKPNPYNRNHHTQQYEVDLTMNTISFFRWIKEKEIPLPDFVFASPLCQSFSLLMNCGKGERIAWKYWEDGDFYVIRAKQEIEYLISQNKFLSQNKADDLIKRAEIGGVLITNILEIIKTLIELNHNLLFYIENPKTSLIWDFIRKNLQYQIKALDVPLFMNSCNYNNYDLSYPLKPTSFLSNVSLNLMDLHITNNIIRKKGDRLPGSSKNETGERVRIPEMLIRHIFHRFKKVYLGRNYINERRKNKNDKC